MALLEFHDGNSWIAVRSVDSMAGAVEATYIDGNLVSYFATTVYLPTPIQSFSFKDGILGTDNTWKTATFSFENPYEFTSSDDGTSAKMIVQSLNNKLSGFKWVHEFLPTDTNPQGTYTLKSRAKNGSTITDTDIFRVNNDNSITFLTPVYGISGGGAITASQITDFNTAVSAFRLDQFVAPTDNINLNGYRIKNLQQSPEEDFDAISAKFFWDLMHDEVEILWS